MLQKQITTEMIWIWVPILAITAPFAYLTARYWVDYQLRLGEAQAAPDVLRRLEETEEALAESQRRIEKLEAVVVDQLLDASEELMAIEAGDSS